MNEIYNPNPTILKTTGKRGVRASSTLWDLGDEQTGGFRLCGDCSVSESIDQSEIFGQLPSPPITANQLRLRLRFGQAYHRPRTQTYDTGGINGCLCSPVQCFE